MIITVILFFLLLLILKDALFTKIYLSLIISGYQLTLTAYTCRMLGLTQLYHNLLTFNFDGISWQVYAIAVIIAALLTCIVSVTQSLKKQGILLYKLSKSYYWIQFSSGLFIFIGMLAYYGGIWTTNFFGNIGIEEMLYTLSQPLKGSDKGQINTFILGPLLNAISLTSTILLLLYSLNLLFITKKNTKSAQNFMIVSYIFICLTLFGGGVTFGIQELGYAELRAYFFEKSTLYEDNFVSPESVALKFPQKKRNLIYIFVESLEGTYLSTEEGGAQTTNLLPILTNLAQSSGINFSNTDLIGGALQVPGVGFTVGGMVGQSAGVPLKVTGGYSPNDYGEATKFMPGLISLGDILAAEDYHQTLLIGSDAGFGGRDKYYMQHGNYEIRDYNYAIEHEWIPEDYKVWWGYEDKKLFEFAKETLNDVSSSDKPFNLTMLTADTHFPDGFMSSDTPHLFDSQYANVIHFSDRLLGEFISWVQEQPFYENTTIVISGDHLSMDPNFFKNLDVSYDRTVFNLILNAPIEAQQNKNRLFSTMDFFPTTLAALGVSIEGDRLGLGTNLFSNQQTLMEVLGYAELSNELGKGSAYYNKQIMQGSDLKVTETTQRK